jgi:adenosylcobinamide-GDP ribazoletransferase
VSRARSARRSPAAAAVRRAIDGAALAVAFLTILPARHRSHDLRAAAPWFALVGALVGGLGGATRYGAEPLFGATIASVLAIAVLAGVTGALHQDGLADCADGLGVRGDRDRRLAVMRDPATGVFGTLALIGWALLLTAALARLDDVDALRTLVVAAVAGRAAALLHAASTPPARTDGLGAAFTASAAALAVACLATIAAAVLLAGPAEGLAMVVTATLVAAGIGPWARRALGGRTGDTLGAAVALVEIAVCLVAVAFAMV